MTYTPGPWHVEPAPSSATMQSIRAANGKAVAFVNRGPDAEANAQAIVALPEVLDALRAYLVPAGDTPEELYDQGKAALAKAEGQPCPS